MKTTQTYTNHFVNDDGAEVTYTVIELNVAGSSAVDYLHILDMETGNIHRQARVAISYRNDPNPIYTYTFEGPYNIANLYLTLLAEDSAGKFANYCRQNADSVKKFENGEMTSLPAPKTGVTV